MNNGYFEYQDPATMTNEEILARHSIINAILDDYEAFGEQEKTPYLMALEHEELALYNEMETRYTNYTIAQFEKQFQ